jgi:hypothetical protein
MLAENSSSSVQVNRTEHGAPSRPGGKFAYFFFDIADMNSSARRCTSSS